MKKNYLFFLCLALYSLSIKAQEEKRLALVIGNSDYKYLPKLKNPVGDAILIGQTLEMLGFEVTLDTNITTKRNFVKTITEFQVKRESFDVGFIFYAGHGVQVDGKNYLLPTQEEFKTEAEVKEFALGAETIIEYLTWKTDEVNVLIFDACRNNPLENTRSTGGSGGLAEMRANGSLIAFSTTAGNVAKDGDGDHSVYSQSLAKNMLIEGISLDQVFRNVRREVLELTGQGTVNYDQLTGDAFYLKKGTFTDQYLLIDSLIIAENYEKGLEIAVSILGQDKNDKSAIIRKGRLYSFMGKYKLAEQDLNLAHEQYPGDMEVLLYRGRFYNDIDSTESALKDLNLIINIDSSNVRAYILRGQVYEKQEKFDQALADYSKAVELDPNNPQTYTNRAILYEKALNKENKAFLDYSKAIELEPENAENWYIRGNFHYNYGHYKEAINDLEQALKILPSHVDAINTLGLVHKDMGEIDLAIETYERGIALEKTNPESAAYCYINRALIYESQEKFDQALADYSKAVELDPNNPQIYTRRAIFYEGSLNEENNAFLDYSKAIELEHENAENWLFRGYFHYNFDHYKEAINDLEQALKVNPSYVDAINVLGLVYADMGKIDLAIETYERGIALEKTNPESAAYCYINRAALIYESQEKFDKALADCSKAVELDPNNPQTYTNRAILYDIALNEENKAFLDYSKAIELEPENAENWYNRGDFHYNYGHNKEAINDLEQALKINPSFVDAISALGLVYEDMGKIDLAIETYERGITLEKTNPESASYCYTNRARIFKGQEKYEKALRDYTKAITLDKNNPSRYVDLGDCYGTLNQLHFALTQYTLAIQLDSTFHEAWASRFRTYGKLHEYEMAITDCEYIISNIDSNDVITLNWMGVYFAYLNEKEKAEKIYEQVVEKYNSGYEFDDWDITGGIAYSVVNLALCREKDLNYTEASDFFDLSVELDDKNPERYYRRSWFKFNCMKDIDAAISDAQRAIDLDPDNTEYLLSKFKLLEKCQQLKKAKSIIVTAKKRFPENELIKLELARFLGLNGENSLSEKEFSELSHIKYKNSRFWNYQIEIKMNLNELNFAEKLANECLIIFPKDTLSRTYLGDVLFLKGQYPESIREYTYVISMMETNDDYHLYSSHEDNFRLSELYIKLANTFERMKDAKAQCFALEKALLNLNNVYGLYDKEYLKLTLEDKIKTICPK